MEQNLIFARSPLWAGVRKKHLKKEAVCQYCGGTENLEVHHIIPFHVDRSLELDERNLITLCEAEGKKCHFIHGHCGDWKKINLMIRLDCAEAQARRKK